jgi:endonuclease/exonuclease/phosphatase family metal-dependent hydrolase
MTASLVSLNICGLSKLETNSTNREWLLGHDIVALQETLHLPHSLGFEGFTVVDEPARTQQKHGPGRRSGGIALLFNNAWLGTSNVEVIFRDWFLLAVRVTSPNGAALLVVNVYTPLHCDDHPPHLDAVILARLESLINQFPGDSTILCGDWNGDLFRLNPGYDRKFLKIDAALQNVGFSRFPLVRRPFTFRQERRKSTIDYVFTRGIRVIEQAVVKRYITNHRPICTRFQNEVLAPDLHLGQAFGRAYPRSSNSLNKLEMEIRDLPLMKVVLLDLI